MGQHPIMTHVKALEANPLGAKVDDSETMGYLCSLGAFCFGRLVAV